MTKSLRDRAEDKVYELLSDDYCGGQAVPLDYRTFRYVNNHCDHVVMFSNDAFELGFGYPDEWHMFIRRESFHKIIRWYLKQWIVSEWCGIRRWAWYKLLHRRVVR